MKNRYLIITFVVIAIVVVFYILRNRKKNDNASAPISGSSQNLSGVNNLQNVSNNASQSYYPLKKGVNNSKVTLLQIALNKKYNAGLEPDGIFGQLTEDALYKNTGKKSIANQREFISAIKV